MTLKFAAAPLTKSDELLKDLQDKVSSGKVGAFSVDSAHILNLEPEVGKIVTQSWSKYLQYCCVINKGQFIMRHCHSAFLSDTDLMTSMKKFLLVMSLNGTTNR